MGQSMFNGKLKSLKSSLPAVHIGWSAWVEWAGELTQPRGRCGPCRSGPRALQLHPGCVFGLDLGVCSASVLSVFLCKQTQLHRRGESHGEPSAPLSDK